MTENISVCGLDCSSCPEFGKQCEGCKKISGKVFWTTHFGLEKCPMHKCCTDVHGLEHCGLCEKLPCQTYFDMRDPAYSEDEHLEGIDRRVKVLRGLK